MSERRPGRPDPERERATARLRQRLWGAAVLIALAVIVLPLLLDGAGSESQFRRVEKLREEPPRIVRPDADAPSRSGSRSDRPDEGTIGTVRDDARVTPPDAAPDDVPDAAADREPAERAVAEERLRRELPRAWVVQAGSFRSRENALAVLDRLRRAGHASFVTDASEPNAPLFRVQVGPMADEVRAGQLRDEVVSLLGREAIVVAYP